MLVIFTAVLTLMLLLLVIVARQAIVQKRRRNSFCTRDENRNVLLFTSIYVSFFLCRL